MNEIEQEEIEELNEVEAEDYLDRTVRSILQPMIYDIIEETPPDTSDIVIKLTLYNNKFTYLLLKTNITSFLINSIRFYLWYSGYKNS